MLLVRLRGFQFLGRAFATRHLTRNSLSVSTQTAGPVDQFIRVIGLIGKSGRREKSVDARKRSCNPTAYNLFVPARLRIFISSTMEDLANERDLVADRLQSFNFEPVNAEGILPTGAKSWDRICEEIDSCHLFVLLLGERYGWVPTKGPLANEKISVTHGEYRRARFHGRSGGCTRRWSGRSHGNRNRSGPLLLCHQAIYILGSAASL